MSSCHITVENDTIDVSLVSDGKNLIKLIYATNGRSVSTRHRNV